MFFILILNAHDKTYHNESYLVKIVKKFVRQWQRNTCDSSNLMKIFSISSSLSEAYNLIESIKFNEVS